MLRLVSRSEGFMKHFETTCYLAACSLYHADPELTLFQDNVTGALYQTLCVDDDCSDPQNGIEETSRNNHMYVTIQKGSAELEGFPGYPSQGIRNAPSLLDMISPISPKESSISPKVFIHPKVSIPRYPLRLKAAGCWCCWLSVLLTGCCPALPC